MKSTSKNRSAKLHRGTRLQSCRLIYLVTITSIAVTLSGLSSGCSDDTTSGNVISADGGTTGNQGTDGGAIDAGRDSGSIGDSGGDTGAMVEEVIECQLGDETGESTRGIGTIEDPIVICSEAQLLAMNSELGWYHVLGQDIVMSESYAEAPIPGEFYADLNGQGFAIRSLTIETTGGRVGLFESLFGSVESLNLLEVSITAGSDSVGALAGTIARADVVDVAIEGVVTGRNFVGGMAGRSTDQNTFEGLRFTGTVNGEFEKVGGLFGQLGSAPLRDVTVQADVLTTGREVGGIVGDSRSGGDFEDVHFEGTVTGDLLVGGIAGTALSPDYNRVSATGTIQTGGQSGGFIGSLTDPRNSRAASIENSFATVDFEPLPGLDEMHLVGGFVGNWGSGVRIRNSYYAGTVRGSDLQRVTFGGLAGQPRSISAVNTFVAVEFELENVVDLELDIIAPNTASASTMNFWWDVGLSGETECHPQGSPDDVDMLDCNPVNADGTEPDWFSVPENEPMASWDVGPTQPWSFDGGPYPVLNR